MRPDWIRVCTAQFDEARKALVAEDKYFEQLILENPELVDAQKAEQERRREKGLPYLEFGTVNPPEKYVKLFVVGIHGGGMGVNGPAGPPSTGFDLHVRVHAVRDGANRPWHRDGEPREPPVESRERAIGLRAELVGHDPLFPTQAARFREILRRATDDCLQRAEGRE